MINQSKDLKQFYSIGEVAEQFGVAESTLRFWEKEFPQISPKNLEQVRVGHNRVKGRGLRIAAAREVLKKNHTGEVQTAEVVHDLQQLRNELAAWRKELGELE